MNLYCTRLAQNVRRPMAHKNPMDFSGHRTLNPVAGARGYGSTLRPSFDVMGRLFSYMALQIKPGERLVTTDSSEAHSLKVASYKLYTGTLLCLVISAFLTGTAFAQAASPRITTQIENSQRATIAGTHYERRCKTRPECAA
jgi:hypothetical protein